jgi:tRNA threonylcarbamoyladenosine biosynthesis protein TsaB
MLILSLDTATREGSCALLRDDCVLREVASDSRRPHAARLPGELAALLESQSVALKDVDGFAVASGPGSFTGMRVGIATMQGLAFGAGRPLIGVSALDALYARATLQRPADCGGSEPLPTASGRIAAWVDAWRDEVYAALYDNGHAVNGPLVGRPDEVLAGCTGERTTFTGDGAAAYQDVIRATCGEAADFTEPIAPLLAGAIAMVAARAFRAGRRPPPHAIRPLYVRRSDAELARDARKRP